MTPEAELELRAIADRMLQAAADGDVDLLVKLDQRFHERLWELADHELLNELAAQVRGRIVAFLRAAARALPPEGLREHAARTRRWWRRSPTARLPWPRPDGTSHPGGRRPGAPHADRRCRRMSGALVAITDSDLPSNHIEEELLEGAGLRALRADCTTEDEVIERCQGADALIVQWVTVGERALDALPTVRFISRLGIGYDMIDVEAATEHGVAVANTPDYCIDEVVCHTLALILDRLRSISTLDRAVREGRWAAVADAPRAVRPHATTIAVIGYGRIGSRVGAALRAIGFQVLVHDR